MVTSGLWPVGQKSRDQPRPRPGTELEVTGTSVCTQLVSSLGLALASEGGLAGQPSPRGSDAACG